MEMKAAQEETLSDCYVLTCNSVGFVIMVDDLGRPEFLLTDYVTSCGSIRNIHYSTLER